MRFLRSVFIVLSFCTIFSSVAQAAKCPNSTPRDSRIWEVFRDFLESEYKVQDLNSKQRQQAMGHALGRLASAVQSQPDRETAFNCVQLALEQITGIEAWYDEKINANGLVMQAAMGMHDEAVARATGVTSTVPLYDLFGGKTDKAADIPSRGRAGGGAGSNGRTTSRGGIHPCGDNSVSVSAIWKFYTRGMGGGQVAYNEKGGAICFNLSFDTYSGGAFENYVCDKGWVNCRPSGKKSKKITDIQSGKNDTVYTFDEGRNSGVRTPTDAGRSARSDGRPHPCGDSNVPVLAIWKFYTRGMGGGQAAYIEKGDAICFNLSYTTFSGGVMQNYACEKGWVSCRPKGKASKIIGVDMNGNSTTYTFDEGKNSGVRTPTDADKTPRPPSPVSRECSTGGRWSLATASSLLATAEGKADGLGDAMCTGDNWALCRDIMNDLSQARDHIFQVFDQNHDGIRNCKKCSYNMVASWAKNLLSWETWLLGRGYRSASGLGTIYYTINERKNISSCMGR